MSPRPIVALAWKEARLLRDVILVVVGGFWILALIVYVARTGTGSRYDWLVGPSMPWIVAGLTGMFAAAVSIAGERQKGTWGWQAVQPIDWWQDLAVKLAAIALAAAIAGGAAWLACARFGLGGDRPAGGDSFTLAQSGGAVLGIVTLVLATCLTSLFLTEPFLAVVSAWGYVMASIWGLLVALSWYGPQIEEIDPFKTQGLVGGVVAALAVGLPGLFRKAWIRAHEQGSPAGISVDFPAGPARLAGAAGATRADGPWRSWSRPSPWWALVWSSLQATRSAPLLGVAAGVGTAVAALLVSRGNASADAVNGVMLAAAFGSTMTPVTTAVIAALQATGSDQMSGRVPWPAERGVSPLGLLAARALPLGAVLVGLAVLAALVGPLSSRPLDWGPMIVMSLVAAFVGGVHCFTAGLVWRSMLLAFAAGLGAALSTGFIAVMGMDSMEPAMREVARAGDRSFGLGVRLVWLSVLPLLLTVVPCMLVRPWLRDDRPHMIGRWVLALVAVHGVWLAGCMLYRGS